MRRALVVLALALGGCVKAPAPSLGTELPRLELGQLKLREHPDGAAWTLDRVKGEVVLLDVWATWCDPCRDSLPLYADLRKQYGARGLKVFAINVDADSKAVAPFLAELKVELPVLLDPGAVQAEGILKVKVMPSTFLIDRRGQVRFVHEGFAEEFLSRSMSEIEALLAEPKP